MKDHLESSIFGDHDQDHDPGQAGGLGAPVGGQPSAPLSRREARERAEAERRGRGSKGPSKAKKKKRGGLRRFVVILLALAVVGGGVSVAYKYLRPVVEELLESNDYPGPGSGTVRVEVQPGQGGQTIGVTLAEADVVKSVKAFTEAAKADARSAGIQPGTYELRLQMKAADALAILVDPANRIVSRAVVPEGKWAVEIFPILSKATGVPVAEYQKAAKNAKAIGLPSSANGNVEGYLFPAAYEFAPDTSATDHLKQMVSESTKRLEALGITPDKMERVVIVASIVEAEARSPKDMGKVARVVENRLLPTWAGGTLGMDSTVNYIFKERGVPTAEMLANQNRYNTRIHKGLPPGPIGNPGEVALKAAADPPAGPWTFFVTVNLDTGETRFTDDKAKFDIWSNEFVSWCKTSDKC